MRMRQSVRVAAFAFLVLVSELVGRSLTGHVDRALHVAPLAHPHTSYYPFLLAGVKVAAALAAAAFAARVAHARATADAGRRVLAVLGHRHPPTPRLRLSFAPRLWAGAFAATAFLYLAQTNAERLAEGRAPLLAPWLHTYALPVFAVVAVLFALLWRALERWLAEYERYAGELLEHARRILHRRHEPAPRRRRPYGDLAPRRRFGVTFESRPPPLPV